MRMPALRAYVLPRFIVIADQWISDCAGGARRRAMCAPRLRARVSRAGRPSSCLRQRGCRKPPTPPCRTSSTPPARSARGRHNAGFSLRKPRAMEPIGRIPRNGRHPRTLPPLPSLRWPRQTVTEVTECDQPAMRRKPQRSLEAGTISIALISRSDEPVTAAKRPKSDIAPERC